MTVGYGPLLRRDGPSPAVRNNTLLQVAASMGLLIENDGESAAAGDAGVIWTKDQAGNPVSIPAFVPAWLNGIALQSYSGDPASDFNPCAQEGSDSFKTEGGEINLPEFGAVQIYFPETCTARVVGPEDEWFVNRAIAGLGGAEEAAIESVLAIGGVDGSAFDNPHLTDTNLDQLNGGVATDPVEGLALLEEQIGGTKKGGVLHAAPATVTYWARYRCIQEPTRQGDLYTLAGTPVVCGYGYIGAYPDGGTPVTVTEDWAFATGPVQIWREPGITIVPGTYREALNRHTNNLTYRAERSYVVAFDGVLQAGVLIDRAINP